MLYLSKCTVFGNIKLLFNPFCGSQYAKHNELKAKSKGEKERYTHLNPEFQRIARRGKKAFLSNQCKEIEENNRMGKIRDLFKKIRHQGNISCKDGLSKGQKWYGTNRSRRY